MKREIKKMTAVVLTAVMSVTASTSVVFGNERLENAKRQPLTLRRAIDRATSNSSAIATLNEDTPLSEDELERAENAGLPDTEFSSIVNWQSNIMLQRAKLAANLSNATAQRDTLGFIVTQHFANIVNTEKALEIFDEQIRLSEKNLEILALQSSVGVIPELDYLLAQISLDELFLNRETMANAVVTAHMELNRLIGVDENLIHEIEFAPEFEPLPALTNVTGHINAQRNNHINVRNARNLVEIASYNLDNFTLATNPNTGEVLPGNGGQPTRAQREIDVANANRELSAQRNNVTRHLQDTYDNIRALEHNIQTSHIELTDLYQSLEIARVQLEVGMILPITIDNINLQISRQKEQIRQQEIDHHLLVLQFRNPNILVF